MFHAYPSALRLTWTIIRVWRFTGDPVILHWVDELLTYGNKDESYVPDVCCFMDNPSRRRYVDCHSRRRLSCPLSFTPPTTLFLSWHIPRGSLWDPGGRRARDEPHERTTKHRRSVDGQVLWTGVSSVFTLPTTVRMTGNSLFFLRDLRGYTVDGYGVTVTLIHDVGCQRRSVFFPFIRSVESRRVPLSCSPPPHSSPRLWTSRVRDGSSDTAKYVFVSTKF